ncbi:MAG: 6-bladed beta-propeller [Rhodothermales bacterium]
MRSHCDFIFSSCLPLYAAVACVICFGCRRPIDPGTAARPITPECVAVNESFSRLVSRAQSFREIVRPIREFSLETTDLSIVGQVDDVRPHRKGFVISDYSVVRQVFLFSRSGLFVSALGREGDAPGEYREPRDVTVKSNGNVLVLSRGNQRIVEYTEDGRFEGDYSLKDLGIRPDKMFLSPHDQLWYFYNLDGDYQGVGRGRKVIVARLVGERFEFVRAFGEGEPTLSRLFFSGGAFQVRNDATIWLQKVFELEMEIYGPSGQLLQAVEDPRSRLPEPYLTSATLADFDRPSAAADTYLATTSPWVFRFFSNLVVASYWSGARQSLILLFYDDCGRLIESALTEGDDSIYPLVRGTWGDTMAVLIDVDPDSMDGLRDVPNPTVQLYRLAKE